MSIWTNFVFIRQWQQEVKITHKWTKNFIYHNSKFSGIAYDNYHSTENITKYSNFITLVYKICFNFLHFFEQYLEPLSYIRNQHLACYNAHLYIYKECELFIIVKWGFPTLHQYSKYYATCELLWSHKLEYLKRNNKKSIHPALP